MPGGAFLFDINTPEKLKAMDGQTYLDETEDVYCVWRADYDARRSRICAYGFDLFEREGELWRREGGTPRGEGLDPGGAGALAETGRLCHH